MRNDAWGRHKRDTVILGNKCTDRPNLFTAFAPGLTTIDSASRAHDIRRCPVYVKGRAMRMSYTAMKPHFGLHKR